MTNKPKKTAEQKRAETRERMRKMRERERRGEKPQSEGRNNGRNRTRDKKRRIAVLDLETDPFDGESNIDPFVAEIYAGDDFPPIVIWDDDPKRFIMSVYDAIENLPDRYIIYAHNGGRFDWMFFIRLLTGRVMFKGNSIMSAKIGNHEIRDSMHIIPEALKNYNKDEFDYKLLQKHLRGKARKKILSYLHSDCVYLYELVTDFVGRFGTVLTIGIAALREIKKTVPFERLSAGSDAMLRQWYVGGRVECLQGGGKYNGIYRLYDVNSMYPYVMANYKHPLGAPSYVGREIRNDTFFIHLSCDNYGAFLSRIPGEFSLTPNVKSGEFFITIHEYRTAKEYGLISNERILRTVGFDMIGDFSSFVLPNYSTREAYKIQLQNEPDNFKVKRASLTIKYLLNNGYGKYGQDPSNNKEFFIVGYYDDMPPADEGWKVHMSHRDLDDKTNNFVIMERPANEGTFNNVATAASITGAARAVLLEGLCNSVGAIYCDTDSIIARSLDADLDASRLGAWDCEAEIETALIAGKKLYGYRTTTGTEKIRCKGADITWQDLEKISTGQTIYSKRQAPTFDKTGAQRYIGRHVKLTTPLHDAGLLYKRLNNGCLSTRYG